MTDFDPLDIPAQEAAEASRIEKARETDRQEAEDLKWIMSDKRGRRFMWSLFEKTGIYRSSFTGNSETFFREGERNIGLKFLALVNIHCPDRYATMQEERNKKDDKRNADK